MTYLESHPPARSQFRRPRRAEPSGAIVVHTAENVPDLDGPDGGAEGVAAFIARRSDPGSYHTVVDADSIVRVVPYDAEAYGEGTGGNPYALHLSFACRTTTWDTMDPARRAAMIMNGARAAADMARWLDQERGYPLSRIPAARITADAYRIRLAGFISHAELDPRRRSDPGAAFPWRAFLDLYAQELLMPPTTENPYPAETAEALQLLAQHAGYVGDRKWFGPDALAALHRLKNRAEDLATKNVDLAGHNVTLASERDTALANREAAEAEAAALRLELQTGGRIGALLADIDAAVAKARA